MDAEAERGLLGQFRHFLADIHGNRGLSTTFASGAQLRPFAFTIPTVISTTGRTSRTGKSTSLSAAAGTAWRWSNARLTRTAWMPRELKQLLKQIADVCGGAQGSTHRLPAYILRHFIHLWRALVDIR